MVSPLAVFTASDLCRKSVNKVRSLTNDTCAPLSTKTLPPFISSNLLAAIINTETPINCKHIGRRRREEKEAVEDSLEILLTSEGTVFS